MVKKNEGSGSSTVSQDPLISFRVDTLVAEELKRYADSREATLKHGIKISTSMAARDMMLEALARRRSEFKRPR